MSELTDPAAYHGPTNERAKRIGNFADVVMKGGITSGIVYPQAICALAKRYRLRNIGGTSAGAIAAGLAAAAEYARRDGRLQGYADLAGLPAWLGGRAAGRRQGNMLGLFQPRRSMRALFELLLLVLAPGAPLLVAARLLRHALFGLGPAPWLGLVPGLLLVGFLTLSDPPATAAGLAAAALLWLLAGVAGLALLSLPVAHAGGRKLLLAAAAVLGMVVIILGPPLLARWLPPGPALVGHAWALEGALLLAALGMLAGAIVGAARKLTVELPRNGFGICSGMPTKLPPPEHAAATEPRQPALAPWLHEQIQRIAGLPADAPLTFRDLEAKDAEGLGDPVSLRMMTTCLTFGRPYLLPFETKIFYFAKEEMAELFPAAVVDAMVVEADRWSRSVAPPDHDEEVDPFAYPNETDYLTNRFMHPLRPLPLDRLPIVVAVRMSLSFPLLLSAVPLWAIDWRDEANQEARNGWDRWRRANGRYWEKLKTQPGELLEHDPPRQKPRAKRCWFSDGGICSNFPVHLFDQLLPRWPTFGINLKYGESAKERDSRVELAKTHGSGILESWDHVIEDPAGGPGRLTGFLGAVFGAMQNWADNSILKVPGYRDRIVHLHLAPDEGGLNLDMTPTRIGLLAAWGEEAGEALTERFTKRDGRKSELSWDNHRWTRLRSNLALLQEEIQELVASYEDSQEIARDVDERWRSYRELIERRGDEHPTSYKWKRAASQRKMAVETFDQLAALVQMWKKSGDWPGFLDPKRPRPLPKFHVRPPLQK